MIVIPDDVDEKRIEKAAKLLREILKESCGAELPIVKESEKSGDGPAFYLGKTKAAKSWLKDFTSTETPSCCGRTIQTKNAFPTLSSTPKRPRE